MNQTIKFFRLNTGEDLITVVDSSTEDSYTLKNPLKVYYTAMENDMGLPSMGVSLSYWVFPKISRCDEFTIRSSDVLLVSDASKDMVEYYTNSIQSIKEGDVYSKYLSEEYSDEEDEEIEMSDEDAEAIQEMLESLRRDGPKRTLH